MAKREHTVPVLQGGGALGAYQAGVYKGIAETGLNRFSAATAATFGVPGFFVPRQPPALLAPDGTPEALSVYDTSPLRETLQELVDFDLLNRKGVRLSVGAVDVRSGNSVYFDNQDLTLGPEHVMASGSLPPGFPPTERSEEHT